MNEFRSIVSITLLFTIVFFMVYFPIERFTKKKPWYYRGASLLMVALLCFLYAKFLSIPVGCYINGMEPKCGADHFFTALLFGLFFALMGILYFFKEKRRTTSPTAK